MINPFQIHTAFATLSWIDVSSNWVEMEREQAKWQNIGPWFSATVADVVDPSNQTRRRTKQWDGKRNRDKKSGEPNACIVSECTHMHEIYFWISAVRTMTNTFLELMLWVSYVSVFLCCWFDTDMRFLLSRTKPYRFVAAILNFSRFFSLSLASSLAFVLLFYVLRSSCTF